MINSLLRFNKNYIKKGNGKWHLLNVPNAGKKFQNWQRPAQIVGLQSIQSQRHLKIVTLLSNAPNVEARILHIKESKLEVLELGQIKWSYNAQRKAMDVYTGYLSVGGGNLVIGCVLEYGKIYYLVEKAEEG